MPKIIQLIRECVAAQRYFFGLELFPPKTEDGVSNLYERVTRLSQLSPLYCSVTWGDAMSTSQATLEICSSLQNLMGLETQMHLTATGSKEIELIQALQKAKEAGIQNLCILRGKGTCAGEGDLHYAVDLIKLVRREFGDYFGISVAGHPEGHPDSDYATSLQHLKQKIDAGADYVITQLFYNEKVFFKFVTDCKEAGITCPIVPGIMPINTYQQFVRYGQYTKGGMEEIMTEINTIRRDDEQVREYGVKLLCKMIKSLMHYGVRGFHFYTLNLERVVQELLHELHLVDVHRDLPWRRSANARRQGKEEIRPIFWSGLAKSYLARTKLWDEFPNGRWGDSGSAAFGEDGGYHTKLVLTCHVNQELFHDAVHESCIVRYFISSLLEGTPLPWSDDVAAETDLILIDTLLPLNSRGFLTINSQPRVNGVPSTDEKVGWGPPRGFVYQKQYVEFFCSPIQLKSLVEILQDFPWISYMYTNADGSDCNQTDTNVNAVTWGVFQGREILQPTVVDVRSFHVWRPEAFSLWHAPFADGSPLPEIIQNVASTYYLVNLVDNEYVNGTFQAFLEAVVKKVPEIVDSAALRADVKHKPKPKRPTQ